MATVFLNGRFLDLPEAKVSAFDAGMQHAVGLFETMLGGTTALDETWVFRLDEHLERLAASARELGLSQQIQTRGLYDAVMETVARSGHERARVRLTVTGGDMQMLGREESEAQHATVMIVAQPATEYPEQMFETGVMVSIADARANPFNPIEGHKTLSYWWRLRELQAAGAKGASEAVVLQVSNHLCGGCVSNVFVVKDGALKTPIARGEEGGVEGDGEGMDSGGMGSGGATPRSARGVLPSPVLPGVTRGTVIELAELRSVPVERKMLSIEDLVGADEVFLTNSSWGVLPVAAVEAHQIGSGGPGPVTRSLREGLDRRVLGAFG